VLRTWVKRHVDGDDRLIGATYVYKEILPAHWSGFDASSGSPAQHAALRPHWPASAPEGLAAAGQAIANTIAGGRSTGASAQAPAGPTSGFQFPGFTQPGARAPGGGSAAPQSVDGGSMPQ